MEKYKNIMPFFLLIILVLAWIFILFPKREYTLKFDDVEKVCEICGSKFKTNKYSKTKTCSRSCANRLKSKLKDSPNL